jgi:hypothetical protein
VCDNAVVLPCPLCDEIVYVGVEDISSIRYNGLLAHRECALRSVLGGIGHLTAHEHWCLELHDSDMGMTYRQSALAVDAWVTAHGIDAALSRSG